MEPNQEHMQVFETFITVTSKDLDELNHVNNVQYVQWVQDVAKQHWQTGVPKDIQNNYFWVMLNHYIEYKNPALLGDTLKIKTYVSAYKAATCTRVVEISHNNLLMAKSQTNWCLIKAQTKRPVRITKEISNLFT